MDVCRRELVCQQAVGWADGVTFETEAIQISTTSTAGGAIFHSQIDQITME